jgi:hypothetical protein
MHGGVRGRGIKLKFLSYSIGVRDVLLFQAINPTKYHPSIYQRAGAYFTQLQLESKKRQQ